MNPKPEVEVRKKKGLKQSSKEKKTKQNKTQLIGCLIVLGLITKMHAKTESEVTSLGPIYYVQSPSKDSHDGEKNTMSFQSTPVISPTASPLHSHSSVGRHSRESSSTRFSESRKISQNDAVRGDHRKGQKPWKDCAVIEEEGFVDVEKREKGIPRRCYFPLFVLGFFLFFTVFSLILWGASKSMKPKINLKVCFHFAKDVNFL